MTIALIVNADDFGLTAGVNSAVLSCHLAGSVTSTTLMANMEAAEQAAAISRAHPTLSVGLHFNLTSGRPLASNVGSLTDETGRFLNRGRLIRRALLGKLRTAHVESELLAQLGRMKSLGLKATHLDSHQHVHAVPLIFDVVSRTAAAEGVPVRMTWRWPGRMAGKSLRRRVSEGVLHAMTRRCLSIKSSAVRSNDGLCSVFDLEAAPDAIDESSYIRLLDPYADGVIELMVHPAIVDNALVKQTAISGISEVENRILRSNFLREYIESRRGRMASYRDVR